MGHVQATKILQHLVWNYLLMKLSVEWKCLALIPEETSFTDDMYSSSSLDIEKDFLKTVQNSHWDNN